ncbi:MAG TPA: hypothetical protein VGZ90_13540 [Puia sp.]|jgi:hypothetical protein|nr:hypothetical protein [Puia sp.]
MKNKEIINTLVNNRENNLSVKSVEVVKNKASLSNPKIMVGTKPYYEWSKTKEITFVITYGRYLNCEMLVYDKQIKNDNDFITVIGKTNAAKEVNKIINNITN